jgi:hypothetical protein
MSDRTYTFNCNSFVSTDPNQNPNTDNPTGSCLFSNSSQDKIGVVNTGADHLIVLHGYQDNPQLKTDVENCLV